MHSQFAHSSASLLLKHVFREQKDIVLHTNDLPVASSGCAQWSWKFVHSLIWKSWGDTTPFIMVGEEFISRQCGSDLSPPSEEFLWRFFFFILIRLEKQLSVRVNTANSFVPSSSSFFLECMSFLSAIHTDSLLSPLYCRQPVNNRALCCVVHVSFVLEHNHNPRTKEGELKLNPQRERQLNKADVWVTSLT